MYDVFFHLLDNIITITKDRKIRLALVLIPSDLETRAGVSQGQAPIMKYCSKHGIDCLQLLDALKGEFDRGAKPYFETDIHWTKDGHRIAARAIERFLQTQFGVR